MNFAVVEIAGKQFLARKGDIIETPKIPGATGEKVTLPSVLLYWNGKKIEVGRPHLKDVAVEGRILEYGREPKVLVYKYKRRKDSHRKIGHRQDFARVKIEKIVIPGKPGGESEKPSAAEKTPVAAGEKSPAAKKAASGRKPAAIKKTASRKKPRLTKTPAK